MKPLLCIFMYFSRKAHSIDRNMSCVPNSFMTHIHIFMYLALCLFLICIVLIALNSGWFDPPYVSQKSQAFVKQVNKVKHEDFLCS